MLRSVLLLVVVGQVAQGGSGGELRCLDTRGGEDRSTLLLQARVAFGRASLALARAGFNCNELVKAAGFGPLDRCPNECPYWVEDPYSSCSFQCVRAEDCGLVNPNTSMANSKSSSCASCQVKGCVQCEDDHLHRCKTCQEPRWFRTPDGACLDQKLRTPWIVAICVTALLLLPVLVWLVELHCRPVVNEEGLKQGMLHRERTKLHMPKGTDLRTFALLRIERTGGAHEEAMVVLENVSHSGHSVACTTEAMLGDEVAAKKKAEVRAGERVELGLIRLGGVGPNGQLAYHMGPHGVPSGSCKEDGWLVSAPRDGVYVSSGDAPLASIMQLPCSPTAWRVHARNVEDGVEAAWTVHVSAEGVRSHVAQEPHAGPRSPYPLLTNMLRVPAGGPAMSLFFRFQFFVIVWAAVLASCWVIIALSVDSELFMLGLRQFRTAWEICTVTAWGHQKQQQMQWVWLLMVLLAYLITFFLSVVHANCQRCHFRNLDLDHKTMGDFVAELRGLPRVGGWVEVEAELQALLQQATGVDVVGVSVCWDTGSDFQEVKALAKADTMKLDETRSPVVPDVDRPSLLRRVDGMLLPLLLDESIDAPGCQRSEEERRERMLDTLKGLSTGCRAFAVFETEEARDRAVLAASQRELLYRDAPLTLSSQKRWEPADVEWEHVHKDAAGLAWLRLGQGFFIVLLASTLWAVLFYVPSVCLMMAAYHKGEPPGSSTSIAIGMLVVVGNQIMYFLCDRVANWVGFSNITFTQAVYVVLYLFACLLNLCLDVGFTQYQAYTAMVHFGIHTADGRLMGELKTFSEIFASYPMQKTVGHQMFIYSVVGCFSVPFVIEPVLTIALPYHLSRLLVGSHPELVGEKAESVLRMMTTMEMGRYADITLDMILLVLMFFFPSGYFLQVVFCLIASHMYIYLIDHYRVLRCVPECDVATADVDDFVHFILILPCGLLAVCVAVQLSSWLELANGTSLSVGKMCLPAFFLHAVVHFALVKWTRSHSQERSAALAETCRESCSSLMAWRRSPTTEAERHLDLGYKEVSCSVPGNWFSSNAVHCLRSKYVYGHNPPCYYHVLGEEHLLQSNPKIGCHFDGAEAALRLGMTKSVRRHTVSAMTAGMLRARAHRARQAVLSRNSSADLASEAALSRTSTDQLAEAHRAFSHS